MGTNNFTCTAKFVAKSAYTYVACNTYIQRVYIDVSFFHRHFKDVSDSHRHLPPLWGEIPETRKFLKYNSGIRNS